jgi:hypothetical protein
MLGLHDHGHGLIFPPTIEGLPVISDQLVLF